MQPKGFSCKQPIDAFMAFQSPPPSPPSPKYNTRRKHCQESNLCQGARQQNRWPLHALSPPGLVFLGEGKVAGAGVGRGLQGNLRAAMNWACDCSSRRLDSSRGSLASPKRCRMACKYAVIPCSFTCIFTGGLIPSKRPSYNQPEIRFLELIYRPSIPYHSVLSP
jgi:hypothetical protein